jgi:hypothetical protein
MALSPCLPTVVNSDCRPGLQFACTPSVLKVAGDFNDDDPVGWLKWPIE